MNSLPGFAHPTREREQLHIERTRDASAKRTRVRASGEPVSEEEVVRTMRREENDMHRAELSMRRADREREIAERMRQREIAERMRQREMEERAAELQRIRDQEIQNRARMTALAQEKTPQTQIRELKVLFRTFRAEHLAELALHPTKMSTDELLSMDNMCNEETTCPITLFNLKALRKRKRLVVIDGRCYSFYAFAYQRALTENPFTRKAFSPEAKQKINKIRQYRVFLNQELQRDELFLQQAPKTRKRRKSTKSLTIKPRSAKTPSPKLSPPMRTYGSK